MRDLELEFTEALKEMEEKLELLNLINRERTLPDDLNNPSGEIDATNVTWFSDKVYELGRKDDARWGSTGTLGQPRGELLPRHRREAE